MLEKKSSTFDLFQILKNCQDESKHNRTIFFSLKREMRKIELNWIQCDHMWQNFAILATYLWAWQFFLEKLARKMAKFWATF